ncbi:MAG: alpha/beta fold hydrolase [Cellvibrionaceae bacterium]
MRLYFEKSGTGEPLIMLHGMFGSFENLGAIARILQDHFTLYRVDLRNHGRSPHAETMSFPEMANDVFELMENQQLESANILGHSLGGKVAMQLAFDHPEKVKKIVVLDIAPVAYPSHHNAILDGLKNINPASAKSRKEVDEKLKNYVDEPGVRQFILKNLERNETKEFFWRLNVSAVINCYDGLREAVGDNDSACEKDILFLKGEKSNYIHKKNHEEIFRKFSNAKIETIAEASHWLHAEDPKGVASKVIRFL